MWIKENPALRRGALKRSCHPPKGTCANYSRPSMKIRGSVDIMWINPQSPLFASLFRLRLAGRSHFVGTNTVRGLSEVAVETEDLEARRKALVLYPLVEPSAYFAPMFSLSIDMVERQESDARLAVGTLRTLTR